MLPSLNQTASRAARRTWLFLVVAGVLAVSLPTAHTVTQPRVAGATVGSATAADLPQKRPADSVAERGREPSDQFKTGNTGVTVEYLPRPTKEDEALHEPLDFDAIEMPFEDCVKLFGQRAKINVVLDYVTLADDGVALDAPITLKMQGGTAGSVLNRLLEPLKLAILIEDSHIKITTAALAGERLITRWYPVWDLLAPGTANAQVESSEPSKRAGDLTPPPPIAELMKLMTAGVWADSWEDLHGPGSAIYASEIQCLIIRQTSEVQLEVLQFLRLWREARRLKRLAIAGIAAGDAPFKLKDGK